MYSQATIDKYRARNDKTIQGLDSDTQRKVRKFEKLVWDKLGILLLIYSGYRSLEEQTDLYQKYQAGGAKAAPPGMSWHNYRRAVDVVPISYNGTADWNSPKWDAIGAQGEAAGLTWGKSFGDKPHFQNSIGWNITDFATFVGSQLDTPEGKSLKKKGKIAAGILTIAAIIGAKIWYDHSQNSNTI